MPFFTRYRHRRSKLAAFMALVLSGLAVAGCSEDRSHLIPDQDSQSLIASLNQIRDLAADNQCFEAIDAATGARAEIEAMTELDPELKRSLLSGVFRLQRLVSDQEICTDLGTGEVEEEPVIEETPEGPTGVTGTTEPETTTGEQGNNPDEDDDSRPPRDEADGNETPPARPPATPETPPTSPGGPTPPGSGGLGPG